MSTLGVDSLKRHDQYYFRDGDICFVVETTVFRLHRHFFERESDYFRRQLLNASLESKVGSPNNLEYKLDDVKSDEFAQFVWVWYNPAYSYSKKDKQTWLTILRLATRWEFHEIRKLAIRHLEKMKLEPIEKITIYKQYSISNELLLPSYISLCISPTLPSPEEGKRLTLDTVLKLASAREQVLLSASERGYKTPTIASAPDDLVKAIVVQLFELTLHSNDQTVRMEGQTMNNSGAPGNSTVDTEVISIQEPNPKQKGKSSAPQEFPRNSGGRTNEVNGNASNGKK